MLMTMIKNPYTVVEQFEEELAAYCDAPYAVAVDSCTNAVFLCLMWHKDQVWVDWDDDVRDLTIPSKTYLSIPMSMIHAKCSPVFDKTWEWEGLYQLKPTGIYDSARCLTGGMFKELHSMRQPEDTFMCLSFHIKKHLPIGKGGMILTDNPEAATWLKKARYEGRGAKFYKDDDLDMIGWNMYMTPEQAARGLTLLQQLPLVNKALPEPGGFRDLTTFSVFKNYKVIE